MRPGGFAELIAAAEARVPPRVRARLRPDWLCDTDPVFAGLHHYERTTDGRHYRDTAHVVYPHHQLHRPAAERRTTVVLPRATLERTYALWSTVHELGHVLDELLGFSWDVPACTAYARTNRREAFAEAFAAALVPEWELSPDKDTLRRFEALAFEL